MPARRRDPVSVPRFTPSYDRIRHDYGIDENISRMGYLSNAVLEDTYDTATRSRGKDHDLLRSANSAIVSTELHSTPRAAVISRKVRASSVPPVSRHNIRPIHAKVADASKQAPAIVLVSSAHTNKSNSTASKPVVLLSNMEAPWLLKARAGSVPPADVRVVRAGSMPPRPRKVAAVIRPQPVGTEGLRAHRPVSAVRLRAQSMGPVSNKENEPASFSSHQSVGHNYSGPRAKSALSRAKALEISQSLGRLARSMSEPRDLDRASTYYHSIPDVKQRALSRYLYAHRGRFGPDSKPYRKSLADFPSVYIPKSGPGPSNRAKAAIIGSRMEAEDSAKKKKKPRSFYAAAKLRETKTDAPEEGVFYNTMRSGGLHSSKPPLPKPTDRKAIRDVDGFTRPKNVMSWQYRVESRLSPDDLIHQPSSFSRMREQVREAQEKMDRHRQLLDRYLDTDTVSSSSRHNYASGAQSPAGGDPNDRPVSDLRRRIRRTIAKAKNNPDYYRE